LLEGEAGAVGIRDVAVAVTEDVMSLDEELIKKEELETDVRRIRWKGDWFLMPSEAVPTERYTKVEDYDPVLKSHCRL
jgi:hypothetical protein